MKMTDKNPFSTFPNTASALACAAALVTGFTTITHAADWPEYRGPNHDGTTTEKIALKWPATGPAVVWKTPASDGFSSFAVAGGKAYTIVSRKLDNTPTEVCLALDASTGKEAWAAPLSFTKYDGGGASGAKGNDGGDGPRSTPTVDGNFVYVLSSALQLFCFEAKSGKPAWKKDLLAEHHGKNIRWQNAASPVIDGDLVFVGGGGPDESLLAFNKADGKLAWKSQTETITHSTPVVATIHEVRQVIFFTQSGLVALATKDGALLWKQPFRFNISTAISPVVGGDIVYCAAGYDVGAAAYRITKTGATFKTTELWRSAGNKPVANHWSTPVHKAGHLYGMFQFKEYGTGPLKCVELATGKVKWEKPGFGPGNVILVDGNLLALADNGELVAVEATPAGYQETARAKILAGKCWSTPVVSNGRVYARSTKEAVCVDVSLKTAGK